MERQKKTLLCSPHPPDAEVVGQKAIQTLVALAASSGKHPWNSSLRTVMITYYLDISRCQTKHDYCFDGTSSESSEASGAQQNKMEAVVLADQPLLLAVPVPVPCHDHPLSHSVIASNWLFSLVANTKNVCLKCRFSYLLSLICWELAKF